MAGAALGEEESPNPFSFKSFLKRGEGGTGSAGVGEKKGSSKSAKTGSSKKKIGSKKTPTGALPFPDDAGVVGGKKSSDDENPFSFVKFVERKSSKPPSHTTQVTSSSGGEEDSSLTVVNPVSLITPLPPHSNHSRPKARPAKTVSSKTTSPLRNKKLKNSIRTKPKEESTKGLSIFDLSDGSDSDSCIPPPPLTAFSVPVATVPPPDLLLTRQKSSGSSTSTSNENSPGRPRKSLGLRGGFLEDMVDHNTEPPFDDTVELRKLRAENERLLRDLSKSEEALKTEKEKNLLLKSRVKSLKKKEAEDTKALADMVQKVESNLVTTTKRAVAAEATIKKLKQEVASLQVQLSQSSPQAVHQHYEELLRGVREKSSFASQQLLTASQMADRSIRELVSGVETLKNVAEILQFIDNISEVRTSDENKTTT